MEHHSVLFLFVDDLFHQILFYFGTVVATLILIWEKWRDKPIPWRWVAAFFLFCLLVSCFQAWVDEHRNSSVLIEEKSKLSGAVARLEAENTYLRDRPPTVITVPVYKQLEAQPPLKAVGVLRFEYQLTSGQLVAGQPLNVNLYLRNNSPAPVAGIFRHFEIRSVDGVQLDAPNLDAELDKKIHADFTKNAKNEYKNDSKANSKGEAINVGDSSWNTLTIVPTQQQVDGILKGTTRFYVYAWATWKGVDEPIDLCLWMQAPATPILGTSLVWHGCG